AKRPEAEAGHAIDNVLDAHRVLADDKGFKILDRRLYGAGLPFERRFAPAVQAGLVRQHLHENPVAMDGVDDDSLDAGNLHASSQGVWRSAHCGPRLV